MTLKTKRVEPPVNTFGPSNKMAYIKKVIFFSISVISVSQQVCSISNHVNYISENQIHSSGTYLDRSAGKTEGWRDLDLSLTGHKYCNDYRNIHGHEGLYL